MTASIKGNPNVTFPVASIIMTVKLRAIRTTPPRNAAAPMRAYFPGYQVSQCGRHIQFGEVRVGGERGGVPE